MYSRDALASEAVGRDREMWVARSTTFHRQLTFPGSSTLTRGYALRFVIHLLSERELGEDGHGVAHCRCLFPKESIEKCRLDVVLPSFCRVELKQYTQGSSEHL